MNLRTITLSQAQADGMNQATDGNEKKTLNIEHMGVKTQI